MTEKIGETLVRIGAMKPYQVDDVLRAQKAGDNRPFGEISIEFEYINDDVLIKYFEAKEAWELKGANRRIELLIQIFWNDEFVERRSIYVENGRRDKTTSPCWLYSSFS